MSTIRLKRSTTAGSIPATSALQPGEVALNITDGNLFFKKTVSGVDSIVKFSANSLNNSTKSLTLNADGTVQFPSFKFPATDGTAGQTLTTDGNGNLTWASASGAASSPNLTVGDKLNVGTTTILTIQAVALVPDPAGSTAMAVQITTTTPHNLTDKQTVTIFGVISGTATTPGSELNYAGWVVGDLTATTFNLYNDNAGDLVDGTNFRPYASGGFIAVGQIVFADTTFQSSRPPMFITNLTPWDIAANLIPGDIVWNDTDGTIGVYSVFTPVDGSDIYYGLKDITVYG
jgi:hypothetical protein